MGVLDDSDLEKIAQKVREKKIEKIFFDPKKARSAFWTAFIFATIFGYGFALAVIADFQNTNRYQTKINELKSDIGADTDELIKTNHLFIDNADCPTLLNTYQELRHNDQGLSYTKNLIKDEIAFRCK